MSSSEAVDSFLECRGTMYHDKRKGAVAFICHGKGNQEVREVR